MKFKRKVALTVGFKRLFAWLLAFERNEMVAGDENSVGGYRRITGKAS